LVRRLSGNAAKAQIIIDEINSLESLVDQLRGQASCFQGDAPVIETVEAVVQQEAPEVLVENTEEEPS
jgi:prefoldin subunit 5